MYKNEQSLSDFFDLIDHIKKVITDDYEQNKDIMPIEEEE